jgi:CPA2 family monovalent cation:H+ antiporter-2
VLALAMGIAVGASSLFGVSMALGAFLAGMVVGQSEFSARAAAEALPMRDAFAVMFFLSVGMLFNPAAALESPLLIATTLGIVLLAKPLAALVIVVLLGYGSRVGLGVSVALAQIGEFSFLVAALGKDLDVLPAELMNPIVAAAMISITLNPILYQFLPRLEEALKKRPGLYRALNRRSRTVAEHESPAAQAGVQAIVVGYGPIGQAVVRLLQCRGMDATVIEMNFETIQRLKAAGIPAVYGDANQREVLERAGIAEAEALILSSSGSVEFAESIRQAREMNAKVHIVARADYLGQTPVLMQAGADEVVSGEGEVALAVADSILRDLGATPDQLDEERERLRAELHSAIVPRAH